MRTSKIIDYNSKPTREQAIELLEPIIAWIQQSRHHEMKLFSVYHGRDAHTDPDTFLLMREMETETMVTTRLKDVP